MRARATKKLNQSQHFSPKSKETINKINSLHNTNRGTNKRYRQLLGNYLKFSRSFQRIILIVILFL